MRFVLYNHVGSANHGCEALVRTISNMLGGKNIVLLSETPKEEKKYGITDIVVVYPAILNDKKSLIDFLYCYAKLKLKNNYFYMDVLPYKSAINKLDGEDVLVSIGGDIFCYKNYPKYNLLHQYALKKIKHSILIGCSIEQEVLADSSLIEDLKSFEIITAREHLTYDALKNVGLKNVIYCPDSAFCLSMRETILPVNFLPGNTVGINISPLILKMAFNAQLIMDNLRMVIKDILDNTDSAVALIPHVAWEDNNDWLPLSVLYKTFKNSNRVCLIEDQSAQKLKWIISKCSCFIGARTHATIAAYSTGVPTLALGYSVKSKGIAQDIFGTAENYVVPYQDIVTKDTILSHYKWIKKHSYEIREVLLNKTNGYQKPILETGKILKDRYYNS